MSTAHPITAGTCDGKRRYRRSKFAKRALRQAQTSFGGRAMHAYHCPLCRFWHVGHPIQQRSAA